ncbi:lycopene cyclase domain-containing protein [Pedobacter sp. SYSU D00535]|uniref:lycopene cyclase domain-containing protein n=1 Tax=Pedobacter sp. SYSU D00535 TaxID=2810308 RepID=UPI001A97B42C|nr:lycopene cyclase domain-containing protein [Pedobacter sp. SYSU D00535]
MDNQYTYLLINFLTIIFPILLSFDSRVRFFSKWKFIFPGLFISGLLFLFWDYLFTIYDVWSFNDSYVLGLYFLNLPLEEILFFITVPFACLFIYECLNYYIKRDLLNPYQQLITIGLLLLSVGLLVFNYEKVYTLITFGLLSALAIFLLVKKPPYLGRFYLAYLVSLLPFYIVNGVLTALPVVLYNDMENLGVRVGTIPLEDHFYSLAMLLMNVLFFEYFRRKDAAW